MIQLSPLRDRPIKACHLSKLTCLGHAPNVNERHEKNFFCLM